MKEIEDAFQTLAEEMLSTGRDTFTDAENETLAEFYGLWQERVRFRHPPTSLLKDERILGVRVSYTDDELELLEKNNISAFRSDGSLAIREVTAPLIRLGVDRMRDDLAGRCWGVLRAGGGEFCVPDVPVSGVIPLTPEVILALDNDSDIITTDEVSGVNKVLQSGAHHYIFARQVAGCPGVIVTMEKKT